MNRSPDGRPFSTFGLKPFLWIEDSDWSLIQKKYRDLSLVFHPDRIDPADSIAMATAEAASARINTDYATLRDFHRRLESVAESSSAIKAPASEKSGSNLELAAEYFELQELKADEGAESANYKKAHAQFLTDIAQANQKCENELKSLAQKFPFNGLVNLNDAVASTPFTESDVVRLKQQLDTRRYLQRMLTELQTS